LEAVVTDTKPPTIFGKPMVLYAAHDEVRRWRLEVVPGLTVGAYNVGEGWAWFCGDRPSPNWAASIAGGADEAARAIESRIRSLVLSLAPLLDPDAKREVVKAMGFTYLPPQPNNFEPYKGDEEPEPFV
jgi:hypothetical protein